MRILILADLHTEFHRFEPSAVEADLVLLAGDVGVGTTGVQLARKWFAPLPVAYVAGNHEFYGHNVDDLGPQLDEAARGSNVSVLENSELVLGDVRILGCTLWTDFRLQEPIVLRERAMFIAAANMADYTQIRIGPSRRRLRPQDTAARHDASIWWLDRALAEPFAGRTVVVTHAAPSPRSNPERYATDPLTCAFASDLERLIARHRIDLWVHGHTHHNVDYMLGDTRVVSNQRGYPDERVANWRPDLLVEI